MRAARSPLVRERRVSTDLKLNARLLSIRRAASVPANRNHGATAVLCAGKRNIESNSDDLVLPRDLMGILKIFVDLTEDPAEVCVFRA